MDQLCVLLLVVTDDNVIFWSDQKGIKGAKKRKSIELKGLIRFNSVVKYASKGVWVCKYSEIVWNLQLIDMTNYKARYVFRSS